MILAFRKKPLLDEIILIEDYQGEDISEWFKERGLVREDYERISFIDFGYLEITMKAKDHGEYFLSIVARL